MVCQSVFLAMVMLWALESVYLFGSGKYPMNTSTILVPTYKCLNISLVPEYKFVKAGYFACENPASLTN